ncbi:MAG TPA: hypothetical protein VIR78_08595 [Malonomonas sp.]
MKLRLSVLLLLLFVLLTGCAKQPRPIAAEPLEKHDLEKDLTYCRTYAEKFGVINMEPVMAGSDLTDFPDTQYQIQLYEACMMRKGYRF